MNVGLVFCGVVMAVGTHVVGELWAVDHPCRLAFAVRCVVGVPMYVLSTAVIVAGLPR